LIKRLDALKLFAPKVPADVSNFNIALEEMRLSNKEGNLITVEEAE